MMRKAIITVLALAAIGLAQPTAAFARGGGGGHGGMKTSTVKAASVKAPHKRAFVGFGFGPYYDGYYPSAWNVPWR
jgi:hypothetical protein